MFHAGLGRCPTPVLSDPRGRACRTLRPDSTPEDQGVPARAGSSGAPGVDRHAPDTQRGWLTAGQSTTPPVRNLTSMPYYRTATLIGVTRLT
jgi:hypothetical protein